MKREWYNNGSVEVLVDDATKLTKDFHKGRLNKGKKCYNNGITERYFSVDDVVPDGFILGALKKEWRNVSPKLCKRCGFQFVPSSKHKYWCVDCYNEIHATKRCPVCGKEFTGTYQNETCCSQSCAKKLNNNFKNPETLEKIKNTNIKKYGCENPFSNPDIQQVAQMNKRTVTKNNLSKEASIVYNMLKNDGIHATIEKEKIFPECTFKGFLPFDFYIPSRNSYSEILIEYDGKQHERPVKFRNDTSEYKTFIHTQITDWLKDKFCIENKMNLIRIPCSDVYNPDFDTIYKNSYIVGKAQAYDKMIDVLDINSVDLVNYKKATFNIASGVSCTFKCGREACQNSELSKKQPIKCNIDDVIKRYMNQNISHTITFQGLETLDNLKQLLWFIYYFRQQSSDTIIIWTGYTKEECSDLIYLIQNKMKWENITIKFGRYLPGHEKHYDEVLGVELASPNQRAEVIS